MAVSVSSREKQAAVAPQLDDIETYISTLDADERKGLAAADAEIDVAILLHRARVNRGLSQAEAAKRAGLQQQAVSRFERPDASPRLETMQAYLGALGYALELRAIDVKTGKTAAKVLFDPTTR